MNLPLLESYTKDAWTAVGPLFGVFVGAMLARSWDRKKWLNDNRKEEYRELLTVLTNAATALIQNEQPGARMNHAAIAQEKYMTSLRFLQDRIFIAREIEEMDLFDRWGEAMKDLQNTHKYEKFENSFEAIKKTS